ncbi:MAG: phosphatase PAP2 family protein [Deltaproteobacteria bacterium]|nr:phosphatase PAP2 family protein [Deltaproteobacteria bacterium]
MKRAVSFLIVLTLPLPHVLYAESAESYESRSDFAEKWLFETLPQHLAHDVKETFWNPWHLTGLAAGAGATLGIHAADDEIQQKFHPSDPMGGAKDVFNIMGNGLLLGGAVLTGTIVSKLIDAPKATRTAGTMLESLGITYTLTYALKFSVQRQRPDGSNSLSFPSGHASGTFALATITEVFYGPLFGVPAYALAGTIALARIDSNKHFVSDTMAGAVLGTLVGLGTAKFHKAEKSDLFVVPTMLESGAGISLVKMF